MTHQRVHRIAMAVVLSLTLAGSILAQGPVDVTANQIGRLTSVGNAATRTYTQYDEQGRAVATQFVQDGRSRIFTMTFGYPFNPQSTGGPGTVLLRQTFPDGEAVSYTYDAGGQQLAVQSTFGGATEDVVRGYRTNARGGVTRIEYGNGTVTTNTYDEAGHQLLSRILTVNAAGQVVQDYRYTYDAEGNVTGTADGVRPDLSATYDYDEVGQLVAIRNSAGNVIESYTYDPIGNLIQKGALTQTYNAGGRPHALETSGGIAYAYDPNGNVTSIGGTTTLEWNAENMATRVTTGAGVTEKSFVGEAAWKKVEAGVTTYYLPSVRIENGVARKYYGSFAERLEVPGDRQLRFYHPDHLGSSSVMTDSTGTPIRRAAYLPWGQERGVEGTFVPKRQFNFKEKDATGFYDYGARLYAPVTGRWLSPDSVLSDGMNRYAYARNNPWTRVDPSGHTSRGFWARTTVVDQRDFSEYILYQWFWADPPLSGRFVAANPNLERSEWQVVETGSVVSAFWLDTGKWEKRILLDHGRTDDVPLDEIVSTSTSIGTPMTVPTRPRRSNDYINWQFVNAMRDRTKHHERIFWEFTKQSVIGGGTSGILNALRPAAPYLTVLGIEYMPKLTQGTTMVIGGMNATKNWVNVPGVAVYRAPYWVHTLQRNQVVVDTVISNRLPVYVDGLSRAGAGTWWELNQFVRAGLRITIAW
ncbi:MAG TPA: RHS repeat-associated core domain-containing protein [Thermoanaerobaculia bacterium]|nr:RHS repeat-associated core domain-containing protein [Thermoanaerobaculia bacterium]